MMRAIVGHAAAPVLRSTGCGSAFVAGIAVGDRA